MAQCGWYAGADAELGGHHRRRQVPARRLLRALPAATHSTASTSRASPATARGPSPGTRFARWRWSRRREPGSPPCAAPGGTPSTTAWSSASARSTGAAGSNPSSAAGDHRHRAARIQQGVPGPGRRLRRPAALRPGRKQVVLAGPGLLVGAADSDDHGRGPDRARSVGIGGDLLGGGWRRGEQAVAVSGQPTLGAGVRSGETLARRRPVGPPSTPARRRSIGGEWRATRMRPCPTNASGPPVVDTALQRRSAPALVHCATDFAGNPRCTPPRTVLIDNNPPAHPKAVALAGGDGWRRVNDFDLGWENPDQGRRARSPARSGGVVGATGYDTGVRFAAGRDRRSLADLSVPASGPLLAAVMAARRGGERGSGHRR